MKIDKNESDAWTRTMPAAPRISI